MGKHPHYFLRHHHHRHIALQNYLGTRPRYLARRHYRNLDSRFLLLRIHQDIHRPHHRVHRLGQYLALKQPASKIRISASSSSKIRILVCSTCPCPENSRL